MNATYDLAAENARLKALLRRVSPLLYASTLGSPKIRSAVWAARQDIAAAIADEPIAPLTRAQDCARRTA